MKRQVASLLAWLEDRTGLPGAVAHFLDEKIPASGGWHQVFGSVAMFLFLTQAFTGILLAFNYAPTPGEAYNSLRYILTEVTGGRLIRGLHHWGASMMIVVVVLHGVQVFVFGAYKKPRETTWMLGVALLLLTVTYGLTGYLLPWDNRAYWGTVVATKIAASAPFAGPYVTRLLGAAKGVGVVTFARFYAVHVLLLPPATMLLILAHVYLVRRHGVTPQPGDEALPKKPFYPVQVFKDTAAIFIAFAILFTLAVVAKVPLEQLADPTDTTYIPRPEWYFLFLFQTLKFFEGPLEIVGSTVYRSQPDGEGDAPNGGDRFRGLGGHRMERAHRGGHHVDPARGGGTGGLLGANELGPAFAGGDGRHRLLPRGELRRLPRRRIVAGAGPDPHRRPQGRGLDDPPLQTARGSPSG